MDDGRAQRSGGSAAGDMAQQIDVTLWQWNRQTDLNSCCECRDGQVKQALSSQQQLTRPDHGGQLSLER